ncbi:MAG: putative major facilitator superfamily transporter [Ilumatobacteraceae bacterium]|nr:putative major facilitator superfamily transporter [Ilumatobacteraceae bacterium]
MRELASSPENLAAVLVPRNDFVGEVVGDEPNTFVQGDGPFSTYHRTVVADGDVIRDTTSYRLIIPWFAWLFAWPVRRTLRRREMNPQTGVQPWWAPPDRLDPHQSLLLGLLAAGSLVAAYTNTLFTQTANYAAKDFDVGKFGQGMGGVAVRIGIVFALPIAFMADRLGRRKMILLAAWLAPIISASGALAPSFPVLVATQTVGRPMGLALDLLIAVAATEEMPKNSRAYAVSVLAMASGLGAGIAVMGLPLVRLGDSGWRLVYLLTLIWILVAVDLGRRLPETKRFERPHVTAPPLQRMRFAQIAAVSFFANLFIAPASFFQNRYLDEIRGLSPTEVALFTFSTATPAALGFVVGGKVADVRGRRRLLVVALPASTALLVWSFSVGGPGLWFGAFGAGFIGGIAYPAFAVYRTELFPTGNRGRAAGLVTAAALIGGSLGLLLVGHLLDTGWSYGRAMGLVAIGELIAVINVGTRFPETAHKDHDELNPEPAVLTD